MPKTSATARAARIAEFHRRVAVGESPTGALDVTLKFDQPTVGADPQVVSFVFSDNSVDSYNDTIDVKGWEFDQSGAGTIALFGHDPSKVENIIGRAHNVRTQGNRLVGDIHFAPKEVNPAADVVRLLVLGGFINSVSVGFVPLEWKQANDKNRPGGINFIRQKLLEISVVGIPANENALTLARAAGIDIDSLQRETPVTYKRGLYSVSALAGVLADLDWIHDMTAWESDYEGDGSEVPGMLLDALKALGTALVTMTQEEVAEMLADKDDGTDTVGLVELAAPTVAQKALAAMARGMTKSSVQGVTVNIDTGPIVAKIEEMRAKIDALGVTRAGRTISAANEKTLRDAHGSIMQACDAIIGIVGEADDAGEAKAASIAEPALPTSAPVADNAAINLRKRKAAAARQRLTV